MKGRPLFIYLFLLHIAYEYYALTHRHAYEIKSGPLLYVLHIT